MEISIIDEVMINTVSYSELVEIYRGGYRRSLKLNNKETEANLYVESA